MIFKILTKLMNILRSIVDKKNKSISKMICNINKCKNNNKFRWPEVMVGLFVWTVRKAICY